MTVTEAEARKLQCRMYGAAVQQQPVQVAGLSMAPQAQIGFVWPVCNGSACMHWHWRGDTNAEGQKLGYCGMSSG